VGKDRRGTLEERDRRQRREVHGIHGLHERG
jgi:hypothetical protein